MALRLAELARSPAVKAQIARRARVPPGETTVKGPFTALVDREDPVATRIRVAAQATGQTADRYRVIVDVTSDRPLITLYTEAPDPATATALAAAAEHALRADVGAAQVTQGRDRSEMTLLREVGFTPGRMVDRVCRDPSRCWSSSPWSASAGASSRGPTGAAGEASPCRAPTRRGRTAATGRTRAGRCPGRSPPSW